MVGITGQTNTHYFTYYLGPSVYCMLIFFKNNNTGALTHNKTIPVLIKRS